MIFVDSSAIYALADASDDSHEVSKSGCEQIVCPSWDSKFSCVSVRQTTSGSCPRTRLKISEVRCDPGVAHSTFQLTIFSVMTRYLTTGLC